MSTAVAATHKAEHIKALSTASRLAQQRDEWAAVCYFYAAYRAVRCAFNNDSRLDTDASARAVNAKLSASSRHVDFHNGHPKRGPGVNDIVRYLYPVISSAYQLLHQKSVEVRYAEGLVEITIEETRELAERVTTRLQELGLF